MLCVPLVPFVPVQPPEAVQLVASVAFQVSVDEAPPAMGDGATLSVTTGGRTTVTDTLLLMLPPAFAQVSVNDVFAVSGAVVTLPDVDFAPIHPFDAVQVVA